MDVNLSKGAIAAMIKNGETDLKPFLQVFDLRLVNTANNNSERYRMHLSDGIHLQQGMLATQMNHLVKSGKLQKGSIVHLTEYICNTIQNRKIIIIINMDVLLEKCDLIGEPKVYVDVASALQPSSMVQSGITSGNPQSYGGPAPGQDMTAGSHVRPQAASDSNFQSYGGSYSGRSLPGGNMSDGVPMYAKVDQGIRQTGTAPLARNYGNPPESLASNNQGSVNPGSAGGSRASVNNYGRPAQATFNQPTPISMNRGPTWKNEAPSKIIPIAALNPYQGRWTIKARVTAKGELRHYNNNKGEGKVFSFDLLDSDGGEIRATCFNAVADQFHGIIEVGKVYLISKGSVKLARKDYNHLNNEYEISLESTSTIEPCLADDKSIPQQQFNFQLISEIECMESNSMVDVIGIVSSIRPSETITRKNGTETHKRTLILKDMSGRSVELTLWGSFCNKEGQELQAMCDSGEFPVLAVKAARVNDFSGKTLGTISTSQLFINPDFPERQQLKQWFDREGRNAAAHSISRDSSTMGRTDIRKTVMQIKDEGLGRSEKPDWITVKATVSFIKAENFCYTACPLIVGDRQCNKKVNNNGDGTWLCERCNKSFPECDYRYLLQLQIQDHTGITWVTAFQEAGEEIMGVSAKELYTLKHEEPDDEKFGEVIRKVLFTQYLFKLKIKEETFSDEQRVKSTVVKAEKVNFSYESRHLLTLIDKLPGEDVGIFPGNAAPRASDSGMSGAGYGNAGIGQGAQPVQNTVVSSKNYAGYGAANQVGPYGNVYGASAAQTVSSDSGVRLLCSSCGGVGHNAQICPRVMNGQGQTMGGVYGSRFPNTAVSSDSSSGKCFKCNQSGHWARDCPGSNPVPAYGNTTAGGRYGMARTGGF